MTTLIDEREQLLLEELQRGNISSFEELLRPYVDRLYNALFRMLGNADDSAELLQETLIRAFRGLRGFQGDSTLYTWLYRIAINLALTHRKLKRRAHRSKETSLDSLDWEPADRSEDNPPDAALAGQERKELLQRALDQLAAEHRAIVVLKDIEGLKYEQIAEVLNLPLGTVRSRLHRARAELERLLRPLFDEGLL